MSWTKQIRVVVSCVALALATLPAFAKTLPGPGNVDARVNDGKELKQALAAAQTPPSKPAPGRDQIIQQVKTMGEALTSLQKTAPGAAAHFSTFTAAPEVVSGNKGA